MLKYDLSAPVQNETTYLSEKMSLIKPALVLYFDSVD